jgi:transposase-like protein
MTSQKKQTSEAEVREIRRRSRRIFSPEEEIRVVLEGLRGEQSVSDLCRREGIASNLYYRWSKDFLEAGKKRLAGDTVREARRTLRHRSVCVPGGRAPEGGDPSAESRRGTHAATLEGPVRRSGHAVTGLGELIFAGGASTPESQVAEGGPLLLSGRSSAAMPSPIC